MERSLEIKNIFDFCRFLAGFPNEITQDAELQGFLNFCYTSVVDCNCRQKNKKMSIDLDGVYLNRVESLSKPTLDKLGQIFSKNGEYSSVYLTFVTNDKRIQIK